MGYNQFAYCFNNPVNQTDSCGYWPSIGKILAAVAIVAVVTIVIAATAGGTMALIGASAAIVKGTMIGGAIGGLTAGGANILAQGMQKDDIDCAELISATIYGAASGSVSGAVGGMSPPSISPTVNLAQKALQVSSNIMISTTTYVSQSISQGNNISPYGLAVATTGGMLAGVMYHAPMAKYVSMSAGVQIAGYGDSVIVLAP